MGDGIRIPRTHWTAGIGKPAAHWRTPAEVVARYPEASIVGSDRIVFRIRGNAYRLVVRVDYQYQRVYIRFVGTHAQYNHINAAEV